MANGQARPPHPNPIQQAGEGANESLRELYDNLPLAGLNVVVTRPREQAAELARRLEQLGANPLLFPLLEIEAVPDEQRLHEQLSRLKQADIAIFISPNAVRYGMTAINSLSQRGITSDSADVVWQPSRMASSSTKVGEREALPASLQIAAVGQASAKALRELGVARVIAPTERFDSESLLALAELQGVAGKRVMIFRGDGGRELLGDTLKARGALVEYVTCYLRRKPDMDAGEMIAAAPSAITVTSSEALGHLWDMLAKADRTGIAGTPLFVPHERIATAARQQGWQHVVVTEAGDDGLLSGLIAWANTERK
ncbi:uroporphyrinogen-III synthase [mine drainage metagenome]|uniref:uroporphyrinogen-III synthase n=1 Tax=mine drainage metagenome TaxID=410659 RepID=A0A1J5SKG2_9ZZZZ